MVSWALRELEGPGQFARLHTSFCTGPQVEGTATVWGTWGSWLKIVQEAHS